jgi:hypothetical protein
MEHDGSGPGMQSFGKRSCEALLRAFLLPAKRLARPGRALVPAGR